MALSADARYVTKGDEVVNVAVKSGATIYDGALLMADTDTGGAAEPYDGNIGAILLGWHFGDTEDDGTSSPAHTAKIARGGFQIKGLAVSGLAGTAADIGKKVYAQDDGTYDVVSQTTHEVLVGHVVSADSSTTATVLMLPNVYGTVGV